MIDLKTTKTHTTADNNTVRDILKAVFTLTINNFITVVNTTISKSNYDGRKHLIIDCPREQLDDYRLVFHDELKKQLANSLQLMNDEYIQFGDVTHAHGIGNNCEYPIQIITNDQIINFGRSHSNHSMYCNAKNISVADNDNQTLNYINLNAR